MTKQLIVQDTNLSEFSFESDGQLLRLSFLNMRDGHEEARIECRGIIAVKYHSVGVPLPLYVGEVVHEEISGDTLAQSLDKLGYGFLNQAGAKFLPRREGLHFVHIEGGEIDIEVACIDLVIMRSK